MEAIRACDAALGFSCLGILLFLRKFKEYRWFEGPDPTARRAIVIAKVKWFISIARNCMIVASAAAIAYYLVDVLDYKDAFILTGEVEAGMPQFQWPWRFNLNETTLASGDFEGPFDLASEMGLGLVMLSIVSILQHQAIVKFYARKF